MYITIWDLDYYYATDRTNQQNVDVMKIASYHKQKGDSINFVLKEADINRPYDIYYIIKNNNSTPNPPLSFFTNKKVKWYGDAFKVRQNWKMSDAMLACRPDYLLYPEHNTRQERAEHIRLLGNKMELLPIMQDWSNSFHNKDIIIDDKDLWYAREDVILSALDKIKDIAGISFKYPIWINKLLSNIAIKVRFEKLHLTKFSTIEWSLVNFNFAQDAIAYVDRLQTIYSNVSFGTLRIKYTAKNWKTAQEAREGLKALQDVIISAKQKKVKIKIIGPATRYDTPFFLIPELIEEWTTNYLQQSWIEFLSKRYSVSSNNVSGTNNLNKPETWPILFRDVLRQTYRNQEFLLLKWGNTKTSINEIPWNLWEKEFKYEI